MSAKADLAGDGPYPVPEGQRHGPGRAAPAGAASALLDREPPEGYLAEWTGHVARGSGFSSLSFDPMHSGAGPGAPALSLMVFRLGAEWLALPTRFLVEVAEPRPVHSLPHRRSEVLLGITNIHGELLICVSLAQLLRLDPDGTTARERQVAARSRFLVIGRQSDRFVFSADEVHGIEQRPAGSLREAPATLARAVSSYTRQVLSWEGRSVGCLDGDLLLKSLNRSVA